MRDAKRSRQSGSTSADPAALADSIRRLGFTDYEAKAYLALSNAYPATAYEVAKLSGLPRANVYSVLRALELKGAIQPVGETPRRYAPVDPEYYFGRHARKTAELCASVVEQVMAQTHAAENTFVWLCEGETDVRERVVDLMRAANESIWIKAPDHLIKPYLPGLRDAARRGVQVILVVFGEDLDSLRVERRVVVFPHEGTGTKQAASDVLFTMTTDSSGVMIATHHPDYGMSGSYTRNRAIVHVVQTLFLDEFYFAEMYAKVGRVPDASFGKQLEMLRQKYRPKDMGKHLIDGSSFVTRAIPWGTARRARAPQGPRRT